MLRYVYIIHFWMNLVQTLVVQEKQASSSTFYKQYRFYKILNASESLIGLKVETLRCCLHLNVHVDLLTYQFSTTYSALPLSHRFKLCQVDSL